MCISSITEIEMNTWNPKYPVIRFTNNGTKVVVGNLTARYLQGLCDNIVFQVFDGLEMGDIHPVLRDGVKKAMKVNQDLLLKQVEEDQENPPDPDWEAMFTRKNRDLLRRCDVVLAT